MGEFNAPVDIANRALQLCGHPRIATLNDQNVGAAECSFAYGKIRRKELGRNLWVFATKRVALRAVGLATGLVGWQAYAAGTTYTAGAVVTSGGKLWVSLVDGNVGNTPGRVPTTNRLVWDAYFGPLTCEPWNLGNTSAANLAYHTGEVVYTEAGTGTPTVYRSIIGNNSNDPSAVDEWDEEVVYASGAVVSEDGTNYQSLVNLNLAYTPSGSPSQWTSTVTNAAVSGSWKTLTSATVTRDPIIYPNGAGPFTDALSSTCWRLPAGFLRRAPDDPKADLYRTLGLPRWHTDDLVFESEYVVSGFSNSNGVLILRFVADIEDVTRMTDLFCEGLAAHLALEVGPILLRERWPAFRNSIMGRYREVIRDARTTNAVLVGSIAPPEDTYITSRI